MPNLHPRLVSVCALLFFTVCAGAPIVNYGDDEPSWTEFGNLPAGRVEEGSAGSGFEAWQNLYFETEGPVEGLLREFGSATGPYAVQPPSYGGVSFSSLEEYESAWIEYMLAVNARLLGSRTNDVTPAAAASGRTYTTQTVNPTMSLAEPIADIPEISSVMATLLGGAMLGIGHAIRRRVKA